VNLRSFSTLQLALGASFAVHAALLTVRFVDPEGFNRVFHDTPLEVILVNARSNEKPDKAMAIAQANMAASPRVWEAMGEAFARSAGCLAGRLMSALEAAEAEGGDWRGRGGAAIVVVPTKGERWERIIDLRVEEGAESLVELRRLRRVAKPVGVVSIWSLCDLPDQQGL